MSMHWSVGLFWALAFIMAAGAAILVMRPLLRGRAQIDAAERKQINIAVYRDQMQELETDRRNGLVDDEQYAGAKTELEVRLAEDALGADDAASGASGRARWLAYGLAGALPVIAFGLYFVLGNPLAIRVAAEGGEGPASIEAMVKTAEQKLKANPKDARGWFMLARTYGALGRWPEARKAYLAARELLPNEAAVWSGLAEAAAMLQENKSLAGEPMQLVAKALQLDPNDPKAHELSGIQAFQEKDYAKAVQHWRTLLGLAPPDSDYVAELRRAIQEARHMAEQAGKPIDLGPSVQGSIEIAAALKAKLKPEAVVFVFAQPLGGQGMPLAAFRASAGELPIRFEFDDTMTLGGAKLSDHKQVRLVARVANSGQPTAAPGDLEGRIEKAAVGSRNLKLVIDRELP